jgi:DNA-binding transcriptional regulator YiaG
MTAKQFKAYRKKLFVHPTEAAAAMGITYNALNHWESGRRPVPTWAVKFLECIESQRSSSSTL